VRHAKCDGFGEAIGSNPIGFGNHFTPFYGNTKQTTLEKHPSPYQPFLKNEKTCNQSLVGKLNVCCCLQ
jgi:hypothetical protein